MRSPVSWGEYDRRREGKRIPGRRTPPGSPQGVHGCDQIARVERVPPDDQMARLHQDRIVLALCQVEELTPPLFSGAQLPLTVMKGSEAPEYPA